MSLDSLRQRLFIRPTLDDLHAWKHDSDSEKTKSLIGNKQNNTTDFNKSFGLFSLTVFSICSVIGSGIYILAGTAGKSYAGASVTVSLLIGAFINGGICLCFAEYSSRYNIIGSDYMYTYITSGELFGYLTGFAEFIINSLTPSIMALAIISYFESFLNSLNINTDNNIFFGKEITIFFNLTFTFNLGAAIIIFTLGIIALFNVKCGSSIINFAVLFNILLMLMCIIGGIQYIDTNNWFHPCNESVLKKYSIKSCPKNATNSFMPYGFEGLMAGAGIALWCIDGSWFCVTLAEESKNPTRDIPRAICICLSIVVILYIGVTFVITGIIPFEAINENSSVADAFNQNGAIWLQRIAALGASSNIMVSALGYTVALPRTMWRFSKDGFAFSFFHYLSPKTHIPTFGTIFFIILGLMIAPFFDLTNILSFGVVLVCIAYSNINIGLLILRYCPPELYKYIVINKNIAPININHKEYQLEYEYPKIINNKLYLTKSWTESNVFRVFWFYYLLCIIFSYLMVNKN
eukprot:59724_1